MMRLRKGDPGTDVEVKWVRCQPGAIPLDYSTLFGSTRPDDGAVWSGCGEIPGSPINYYFPPVFSGELGIEEPVTKQWLQNGLGPKDSWVQGCFQAKLTSHASINARVHKKAAGKTSLQGRASLHARPSAIFAGVARLQSVATITARPSAIFAGVARLECTSEIDARPSLVRAGRTLLYARSEITARGTVTHHEFTGSYGTDYGTSFDSYREEV